VKRQASAASYHYWDKNSSGDEIANVNVFMTISHMYFKIPKKESLLRLTN